MKKRWTILIALVSLVIGVAAASWYWLNFNAQFTRYGFVARTEAGIVTKVAVLERLRAGKVAEATHLMETLLDGDLIGADALAREGTKFNASTRHAVELEIKARAASGYAPSNDNVRNAVQDAFRLLSASSDDSSAQPSAPRDAPQAARP